MKFFFTILLILTLAGSLCAEPVKIGIITSLTGPAAKKGQNLLEGVKLAEAEINQTEKLLKLIVEDDATQAKNLASAFAKLATVDKVNGVIGGTWDFLAETAFPLSDQYKIPFITPTNPIEILSDTFKKSSYAFTNGLTLAAEKDAMRSLLKAKKIHSMGLAYVNVPYGTSHARLGRELAKELGIEVILDEEISYEGFNSDIKNIALKTSSKKPDLVFLITNYEGTDLFARELFNLKTSPILLTTQALDEAFRLSKNSRLYRNAFGIYPKILSSKFIEAFTSKFNHPPRDYAGSGYDALMFMYSALQLKELTREQGSVNYLGVTGKHSTPSPSGLLAKGSAVVMTTSTGEFKKYKF